MLPLHPNTGAVTVNPQIHKNIMKEGTNMNTEQKVGIAIIAFDIMAVIYLTTMYPLTTLGALLIILNN